jgi:predicted DNA-binding antitoxin AbrB/MazE fold protein
MNPIHAIYEDGVFKPTERVDLPEHCRVKVELEPDDQKADVWDDIYAIMSERFHSGEHEVAARHDEHQRD